MAMKLSTYMELKGISDAELASKVKRERSTVTRWRLDKTRPDWDALAALEKATEGAVTYRDFARESAA